MLPACPVPVLGPSFKRALRLGPHRPSPWACQPFCLRAASLLCCHAFLCLVCCARPGNVRYEPALAGGLGPVHHWLRTAGLRTGWLSGSDSPKSSRLPLRQAISALPTRNEQEYYHLPPTTTALLLLLLLLLLTTSLAIVLRQQSLFPSLSLLPQLVYKTRLHSRTQSRPPLIKSVGQSFDPNLLVGDL
jgi:hypothetical protein